MQLTHTTQGAYGVRGTILRGERCSSFSKAGPSANVHSVMKAKNAKEDAEAAARKAAAIKANEEYAKKNGA